MRIATTPMTSCARAAAKESRAPSWTLLVVFAMSSLVGCGGSSPAKTGTGGQGAAATGTGGRAGGATGTDAGTGTGGRAAGGTTGSGGATGTGGGPADAGAGDVSAVAAGLGKACATAADCGGGLTCLLPTDKLIFGQGGPANGYCTFACTVAGDDTRCQAAGGNCFDLSVNATDPVEAYCVQTCPYGVDVSATAPTSKCHGRMDVGCLDLAATATSPAVTACIPMCGSDSDCPSPRKCDPRWNVCMDAISPGGTLGAHCVPPGDAGTSTCSGFCLSLGSATATVASFCSTACVLGSPQGCNYVPTSLATGGVHGVCAIPRNGAMIGDVGYCANECDTVADCPDKVDPAPICDLTFQMDVGHGICNWGTPGTDGGTGG